MAKHHLHTKASKKNSSATKGQLLAVRGELKSDVKRLGQDLRQEMKTMGQDLRQEMKTMGQDLRQEMQSMEKGIRKDMVTMEGRILTGVQVINEQLIYDFRGAHKDEIELLKDKDTQHDQRITRLEEHVGLVV